METRSEILNSTECNAPILKVAVNTISHLMCKMHTLKLSCGGRHSWISCYFLSRKGNFFLTFLETFIFILHDTNSYVLQ